MLLLWGDYNLGNHYWYFSDEKLVWFQDILALYDIGTMDE